MKLELKSKLTCPHCQHEKEKSMPENACWAYYKCEKCGEMLKPLKGDCCVFCSYGTNPCPPIQKERCGEGWGCRS